MEYFVSPQPSSPPEVRSQDLMQRKADLMAPNTEFQTPGNGWTPMAEEFGPRRLKWFPNLATILIYLFIYLYFYIKIWYSEYLSLAFRKYQYRNTWPKSFHTVYVGSRLTNTRLIIAVPVRSRTENAFFPYYNRHWCWFGIGFFQEYTSNCRLFYFYLYKSGLAFENNFFLYYFELERFGIFTLNVINN